MDATATIIAAALDIAPSPAPQHLALALGELGYVIKKAPAPRKPAAPVEVFAPNTGDPKVDAFMRAHHDPKYRPLPLPKTLGLPPLRAMRISEQDEAERAWRTMCQEAQKVVDEGRVPDAEAGLRELIALHRNPWVATSRVDEGDWKSRRAVTTYESARHGEVRIQHIVSRDPIDGATYRVEVAGTLLPQIHYAIRAAEAAADLAAASRAA